MSTIAIIMTTFNGENYVKAQIESILASTYQDFELYIFDDGSKDNTMSILRSFEKRFPDKVHVTQNEINLGVTQNFLHAVSRTVADYIMFSDQDDVWKPQKMSITLKRMRHMEAQLAKEMPLAVFTDAEVVDQELNVIRNSFHCSSHLNPYKTDLPHLLMENKLIGCTVMINAALRKILQSHPLPKQARYHDWWLALIAASMGKIGYVREGTLLYRQHGGNVVGNTSFVAYIQDRLSSVRTQKEALLLSERQAQEFLSLYEDVLSDTKKDIIRCFAGLSQANYLQRRKQILCYGFLKSGIVRNIALMIIV